MAMTLAAQVPDGGTVLVLIDTNPIIYVLDGNPFTVAELRALVSETIG